MNKTPLDRIIKKTGKALSFPQKIEPLKPKMKRIKAPKYDTGEKAWTKQINEILTGKKHSKAKWPDEASF